MEQEINQYVLKSICGAVLYNLRMYNKIFDHDWRMVCSYSPLNRGDIYSVEVREDGFTIATRNISFKYIHSNVHEKRIIEIMND